MTEPGGPAWRQTTFFPFAMTSRLAVGDALEREARVRHYETSRYGEVPLVDAVATHDAETGPYAVFLVNRSLRPTPTRSRSTSPTCGTWPSRKRTRWPTPTSTPRTHWTDRDGSAWRRTTRPVEDGRLTVELPPSRGRLSSSPARSPSGERPDQQFVKGAGCPHWPDHSSAQPGPVRLTDTSHSAFRPSTRGLITGGLSAERRPAEPRGQRS